MTRQLVRCLHCREPLAYAKPTGIVKPRDGVVKRWDEERVLLLRCPVCRHERRVTVGEEREAA